MLSIYKQLPSLIKASLEGDKRTVELSTMSLIRKLKKEFPAVSEELANLMADYNAGAPLTRSLGIDPPPVDKDSFSSLVQITDVATFEDTMILNDEVNQVISRFIKERELSSKLIANGIKPPNSLLLFGPPGVGKTLLSKYVAHRLSLPLITLDLSSAISSYLGKTGQNLKKVLEYGKENPAVLLLDEFDAIAKTRDDPTDLGELKRIVNVLLKELEEWPSHSVIIGATNYSEFLDKAIWRRFDLKLEIHLPDEQQRLELWKAHLNKDILDINLEVLSSISEAIGDISPSDIKQISEYVLRQVIIDGSDGTEILIKHLKEIYPGEKGNFNKQMIGALNRSKSKLSQAKIAEILGISPSTVNHHIKAAQKNQ
ncbi:AAA family ATPase [Lysinibacillus sp. NPDC092081]|uniref:AAA family ATPase n=1 Tax=Lysinibacillus sp. NPDC092081 TaxID=3364131 RepID=UPI00380D5108